MRKLAYLFLAFGLSFSLPFALSACGGGTDEPTDCTSDVDCLDDESCIQGVCVFGAETDV